MKILSISNVSLVGSLMLGVWAAWSATGPQRISGNQLVAGCLSLCIWQGKNCEDAKPKICTTAPDYCVYDEDAIGECKNVGFAWQCKDIPQCLKRRDKLCSDL